MAIVKSDGVEVTSLTEYKQDIENVFKEVFGNNFIVDSETKQGQLIGRLALALTNVDNAIADSINATNIYTAIDKQIDNIASNLNIPRKEKQNTEVTCQLTGIFGTIIAAGSTAEDENGNKFSLLETVTIPISGTVNGTMVAIESGRIIVLANQLNKITVAISGWETINNSTIGVPGYDVETNSQYIKRYISNVMLNSSSQIGSIRSSILSVADVKQVLVIDNDTTTDITNKSLLIPKNSISCIVLGGTDQDIVNAIGIKKPVGIPLNGTTQGSYVDITNNIDKIIKFYRAEEVLLEIQLSISTFTGFPSDGIDRIKANIVDYFNGTFNVKPGYNTTGSQVGEDVKYSRIYTPINQVIGHEVNSYTIGIKGQTLSTSDVIINLDQIALILSDDITIMVT